MRRILRLKVILVLLSVSLSAQPGTLLGTWQGSFDGIQLTMSMGTNMRYQQTLMSAVGQTWQTGNYTVGEGVVHLDVDDWEPKSRNVFVPTGTVGGYYVPEANAKPPGGTFKYQFDGPDVLLLHDINLGGTVMLERH